MKPGSRARSTVDWEGFRLALDSVQLQLVFNRCRFQAGSNTSYHQAVHFHWNDTQNERARRWLVQIVPWHAGIDELCEKSFCGSNTNFVFAGLLETKRIESELTVTLFHCFVWDLGFFDLRFNPNDCLSFHLKIKFFLRFIRMFFIIPLNSVLSHMTLKICQRECLLKWKTLSLWQLYSVSLLQLYSICCWRRLLQISVSFVSLLPVCANR